MIYLSKAYLHTHLAQQVFLKCNATTLCCHLGQIRGGELLPTKFKLFIDIKSSKWIIIKNNTKLTLTQPEMLATRMGESWTHYHSI